MTKRIKNFFLRTAALKFELAFGLVLTLVIASVFSLATVNPAAAGDGGWWETVKNGGLDEVGTAFGGDVDEPQDPRLIVADIIRVILGFLGLVAVVLVFYAGFRWMTSGGNEETVSKSKQIMIAGIIGLIIILSAYLIANFVINRIYSVTTGQPVLFN